MGTLLSCFTTMRLVVFALVMLASYAAATTVDTCLKTGNTAFQPISISNEGDCTAYPSLPFPNTPTVDCLSHDVGAPGNAAAAEAANAGATEEEKVCHFNHVWYAPSVQPFPECPTLDNKPNCRMDGSVVGSRVDYAPFTKDWLCEMNHDLQVTPTSECFAFLRQSVCMRFDPDVLAKSLRVFAFAPAQKHQAHFESLALCSTPEICTFMNDKCGAATFSAPFELCGVQNCRSDRDCANWPFGDKSASCITAETTGMDSNRLLSECVPITPSCDAESRLFQKQVRPLGRSRRPHHLPRSLLCLCRLLRRRHRLQALQRRVRRRADPQRSLLVPDRNSRHLDRRSHPQPWLQRSHSRLFPALPRSS